MSTTAPTPASERSQYLTPMSERSRYLTPPDTPSVDVAGTATTSSGESTTASPTHEEAAVASASSSRAKEEPLAALKHANDRLEHEADDQAEEEQGHEETQEEKEDKSHQVDWESDEDPENPQNWSPRKKWSVTVLVSVLTVNVTFASSAPSSATMAISQTFGVGSVVSTLLLTSLFLCGYIFGPIVWSTFSELFGRRPVFIGAMGAYTLLIIGQPLAKNAETFGVTRFLSGLAASAPLTNAGGTIADMMDPVRRGFAMSLFSGAVFLGPVMGPLAGSFLTQEVSWEWVFWVMTIFAGVCWLAIVLFLPESFAPVLLMKKARRLRKEGNSKAWAPHERIDWSVSGVIKRTLFTPFHILALEPMLLLITIYLAIVYGLLYGLFEAVPVLFSDIRGFNLGLSSLPFLAVLVGTTLGAALNVALQYKYFTLQKVWKNSVPPEERLNGSIIAAPLLVIGIFWLGWTGGYASIHWVAPVLALIPIGMSFTLLFIGLLSYITDSYLMYSASALAANTIFRSALGAGFPLFTRQLWDPNGRVGPQWASTLLGCIALLLAPSPYLFYRYGAKIRKSSKWAPCPDFEVREQLEKDGILPNDSLNSSDPDARTGVKAWKKRQEEIERGEKPEKRSQEDA